MPRKPKAEPYRYIPDWMQARSRASKAAWEKRWEAAYLAGEKLSKKAEAFIEKIYGPIVEKPETGTGGGGAGGRGGGSDDDSGADYEEWPDYWDFGWEEEDSPAGD